MSVASASRAKDRTDFQVFNEIGIIAQLSQNRMERSLPKGMSMAQFGVLNHFSRLGGTSTPAELAGVFQVTKGAMTNTLQKLEAQGFITMEPHADDGRKKIVAMTATGVSAHAEALIAVRPRLESVRAAFSDGEFEKALPFLKALRHWLDHHR